MAKTIIATDPTDIGGAMPHINEMTSEQIIGDLKGFGRNADIMSSNDPLKDEYAKYLADKLNSTNIVGLDAIDYGADGEDYFADINLGAELTLESVGLADIDKSYFIGCPMWANFSTMSTIIPPNSAIDPVKLMVAGNYDNLQTEKIGEVDESFIEYGHTFEPQELTSITHLIQG